MTCGERLVRCFGEADWLARLILTTCFAALLNFGDCFLQNAAASRAAGTFIVDGYELTICYLGPPAAFHPRFFILGAMLLAALSAFKRTPAHRVVSGTGLAGALVMYIHWWIRSYDTFQNFQLDQIDFLDHTEISQVAYLYGGSRLDIFIALSIVVCLVLVLDRLFDGEKCMST